MNSKLVKRFFDIFFATTALFLVTPIVIAIAASFRIKGDGGPVLFRQVRPGLHGKPFVLYKFRTMTDARDENGELLPDADRLTNLGLFLRNTSLDELPELYNVIKGHMSIVGPRPLLMKYLDRYTPEQARRHDVCPGITGWAQINGRNTISWEEKFKLDVWYVDNKSLYFDLKIIALTIWKIIKREGISQSGHATAEEFNPQISADLRDR